MVGVALNICLGCPFGGGTIGQIILVIIRVFICDAIGGFVGTVHSEGWEIHWKALGISLKEKLGGRRGVH